MPAIPKDHRFWSRVDNRGGEEACWEWIGPLHKGGYGRFAKDKRHKGGYAHRDVYEMVVGPIPEGLFVCHHCDNRRCVNPKHLYAGTAMDNARDMFDRGRNAPAQRALGSFQEEEVRLLYAHSGMKMREIAELFGVSVSPVSNAIGPVRKAKGRKPWTGKEQSGQALKYEMLLAKQHSTLNLEEIARLYGVSRRTVISLRTSKDCFRGNS